MADLRRTAQTTGDASGLLPEQTASSSSSSGLGSLFGGSISSLISTFLGSGASSALSGLSGTSVPLTGGGSTTSGSSGSDFSSLPPEVIQMLANAGISLSDLTGSRQKSRDATSASSDKTSSRMQSSGTPTTGTTQEQKFVVRWADAMLSTVFTALSVALQTQDFINLLKDFFRPIFGVSTTTQPSASAATTNMVLARVWTPSSGTSRCRLIYDRAPPV